MSTSNQSLCSEVDTILETISPESLNKLTVIICGNYPPPEFTAIVQQFTPSLKCNVVFPHRSIAYRCYTCSYSPYVAICGRCFDFSKHEGHNYRRFISMGGVCDCGDNEALKPHYFCDFHGDNEQVSDPPAHVFQNAIQVLPKILMKFANTGFQDIDSAMLILIYLNEFVKLGYPIQKIISPHLTGRSTAENDFFPVYLEAKKKELENFVKEYHPDFEISIISRDNDNESNILHVFLLILYTSSGFSNTFIEFFMSLTSVDTFKTALVKGFVKFYPYFMEFYISNPKMFEFFSSMPMFSTQILSSPMCISEVLQQESLIESILLFLHFPIGIRDLPLIWPPVQDFLALMYHKQAAMYFLNSQYCVNLWFKTVDQIQGFITLTRLTTGYVEEMDYYAMRYIQLDTQLCTLPVWAMLPHLDASLTNIFIHSSLKWLMGWASTNLKAAKNELTFNLPLHRILSLLISHQLRSGEWDEEALSLDEANLRLIVEYPLRTQAGLSEVLCKKWIRNGFLMDELAYFYKSGRYISTCYDPDIFLTQFVCSRINTQYIVESIIEKFSVLDILAQDEWDDILNSQNMMEEALFFFAHILSSRVLAGETEEGLMREEFITLLSFGEKTYTEIIEALPDRGHLMNAQWESFADSILDEIAVVSPPAKEPDDRKYILKDDFMLHSYDPVLARMRCLTLRGYTESLENYFTRVDHNRLTKNKDNLWPPFRIPNNPIHPSLKEFSNFLHSRLLHALIYTLLSECLASGSNHGVLQVTIHLLHMILVYPYIDSSQSSEPPSEGNIYINCLVPMQMNHRVLEPYGLKNLFEETQSAEPSEIILFEKDEMEVKRREENQGQDPQPVVPRKRREISPDETIVSMLLKLYEQYAKKLYNPTSLHKRDDELRIGGGDFFIGEVIDKLVAGSEEVRKVVEDLTGEDDGGAKKAKLDKKKKSAKDKMKKMMEEKRAKAKQFLLESGEAEENVEEEVAEEVEEEEVEEMPICCICNSEAGRQEENPPVYVAFLSKTNILGLRRFDASDKNIFGNYSNNLKIHTKSAFPDLMLNFQWYDQGMLHICGHVMHKNCHTAHMENTMQKRKQEVSEYWCPMCRQLSNTFLPLPHRRKLPLTETPYPDFNLVKEIFDSDQIESSENIQDAADSYRKFLGNDAMLKLNMINLYRRCVEFELIKSSFLTEQNNAVELGASVFVKPTKKIHLGALYRVCNEYLIGENLTEAYQPQIYVADNIEERSIEIVTALVDLKSLLIEAILHNSNGTTGTIKALICFYINLYVIQLLTWIVFCTDVRRIYGWIKNDNLSESDCGFILGKLLEISNEFTHKRKKSNVAQLSKTIISRFSEFLRFCVLVYNSVLHPNEPTVESIDQLEMSDLLSMLIGGQHGNNVTSIRCYFWEDETLQYYLEKYAGSVGYLLNKEQEFKIMKAMMTIHWETPNFVTLPSTFEQFRVSYDSGVRPDNLDSILCLLCGEVNQIVNRETHRRLPTYILLEREVQILLIEHAFRCGNGTCIFVGTANNSTLIIWERRSIVWKSLYVDRYGQEDLLSEEGREMRLDENRLHYLRSLWLYDQFDKLLSESPNLVE